MRSTSALTDPSGVSGRPIAPHSGIATPSWTATDSATARVSFPAPARRAAAPASRAAPGVARAPPTTSTAPREYLSAPGAGSGHSRRSDGVTRVAPEESARPDTGVSRVLGDGDAL